MEEPSSSSATSAYSPTVSEREQWMVGGQVFEIYNLFLTLPPSSQSLMLEIQRVRHIAYLTRCLRQLPSSFVSLDCNRPWMCFWILHSIALLGESVDDDLEDNAIDFLSRCQDLEGGYGGGPGQLPHLATTYAAVNSLITLGGEKSLSSINRDKLLSFLLRMKHSSGGFRMHDGGEIDVRACYTAISVASILNILDDELVENVGNYILSCQTYEGGIGGEPGSEAHGGYTFCGLAAMILINEVNRLDLSSLINWVVFRQGVEGGFQGRTNKLVDGCYSFWQGGVCALIQRLHTIVDEQLPPSDDSEEQEDEENDDSDSINTPSSAKSDDICEDLEELKVKVNVSDDDESTEPIYEGRDHVSKKNLSNFGLKFIREHAELEPLFHSMALQQYILLCSKVEEGFRDKPGKHRDLYHTCYCLSGLSVSQYSWSKKADSRPLPRMVMGPFSNLLQPIHPLYNLVLDRFYEAHRFFSRPPN